MPRLGPYLYQWRTKDGTKGGYHFWCPGCQECHTFKTEDKHSADVWKYNSSLSNPTFTPSLLLWTTARRNGEEIQPPVRRTICHLIVTDGQIYYCPDSPHGLSGKTVPMEPIPPNWGFGDDP